MNIYNLDFSNMDRVCCVLHVCIISLLGSSGAITVQQFPGSLFGSLSDDAQITCQHDDSSYYRIFLYQQVKGQQALELVGFLANTDVTQDEKYKGKFNLTGDGNVKGQSLQKVSQWPSQSVVTLGSTVELQWSQSSSDSYMYWYRQQRSTGLQLIMLSVYMSEPERGEKISDRFSSTRPKMEIISLTISQAEESDTGVYFCAASHTAANSVPAPVVKLHA
ncbi:hypothetical protein GJAV_G00252420 [Gymnothorax javanicus]|nr:hypothetical protein GJAV_G00252420 [Gymnothorax javanicus]